MTQGVKPKVEMTENKFKPVEEQLAYIKKGVAEIIPEPELAAKLEASRKSGKPLRVYLGVDPTAPDLHLGHTVVLRKLKHFQDLGHTAVFLIGDFSAMIGDPTGVSETRPPLTREQVDAYAKTYLEQVFKILDCEKTEVRYNSEWLGKLSAEEIVRLCSKYSLARMLEREDFRSRLQENQPISVHELLYPLLTAVDAVNLKSDIELGATEQKFNLLVHRAIQREYGLPGQAILTMPILVGTDGQRKMSKSLGNYVGITEDSYEMFKKIMSISDSLMWDYLRLLTDKSEGTIRDLQVNVQSGTTNPRDVKISLASEIVGAFHGEEASLKAAATWKRQFSDRQVPDDAPVKTLSKDNYVGSEQGKTYLSRALLQLDAAPSRAEAERLIKQGAVELDGIVIKDPRHELNLNTPRKYLLRVGKKNIFYIEVK
ncbi:MAG TPA: tyrosine--tRNA ligase [Candidatus Acidoferrum sp.]|nr:tyrosine--tRNA ligase [Candidatus Acidoferrum sp.]